jgi:seryl-tRNA synthetase
MATYDDFDFGFTSVSADEYAAEQKVTVDHDKEVVTTAAASIAPEIKKIEAKLDKLASLITDSYKDEEDSSELWNSHSEALESIESKVDKIIKLESEELTAMILDQGTDLKAVIKQVEERKTELDDKFKDSMEEIENLTVPLLKNLAKDGDTREYIRWPNRTVVLGKQIDRILAITRG